MNQFRVVEQIKCRKVVVNDVDNIFSTIRKLLPHHSSGVCLGQLCSIIISHEEVSTLLFYCQSYYDPLGPPNAPPRYQTGTYKGITSIIDMTTHRNLTSVRQFREHVISMSEINADVKTQTSIKSVFASSSRLGWIINERVPAEDVEIPIQSLTILNEDLVYSQPVAEQYHFEYYVLVCKIYREKEGDEYSDIKFINKEEKLLVESSIDEDIRFEYKLPPTDNGTPSGYIQDSTGNKVEFRLIIFFTAARFKEIIDYLGKTINAPSREVKFDPSYECRRGA